MTRTCGCSIRAPGSCCASTCGSSAAAIASRTKTARRSTPLSTRPLAARAPKEPARTSARSAKPCIAIKGEVAVRRILGVLALAKKYGVASTDDACAAALETGACEYRFVRRYLERNPQLPLSLRQVDPLIRQLTLYRDLIENTNSSGELTHES